MTTICLSIGCCHSFWSMLLSPPICWFLTSPSYATQVIAMLMDLVPDASKADQQHFMVSCGATKSNRWIHLQHHLEIASCYILLYDL
jgi:hypothetical protein